MNPDDPVALARDARDRGHAALGKGDVADALRWFDRALRLVPLDPNIALSLATILLGRDTARAASLFDGVAATADVREAWQGLAAARLLLGDPAGAAICLARSLSRAAITPSATPLADDIARRAGEAGWCGITAEGGLALHPVQAGTVACVLDGRPLRGKALPAAGGRSLEVTLGGRPLLGSPIDLAALRRVVGCVEAEAGGLRGWAWQPGNPDADPVLLLRPASGPGAFRLTAENEAVSIEHAGPLARPRGFVVTAERLARFAGPWHVLTQDGRDLLGSPLDPTGEQRAAAAAASALARLYPAKAAPAITDAGADQPPATGESRQAVGAPPIRSGRAEPRHDAGHAAPVFDPTLPPPAIPVAPPPPPPAASTRRRPVDVVVPVHGNTDIVLACLDSVRASLPRGSRIVVVDDASEEPALIAVLDRLAAARHIRLIRNPRNQGFPASANAGIAACPGRDVVLLNSDTLVPPDWLDRLRDAAYSSPGIGTATPLSNDATILSYPQVEGGNAVPNQAATDRLAALAWKANAGTVVDLPVGVGFCLYIRRDCLDAVGLLRADVFAQGYGEENDFCLRARQLGWRHVGVPGVFVAHRSGASFGGPGGHLQRRNERLLNRLHPGYQQLVADFIRTDTLAEARRRLDLARWRAARPRTGEAVLLVTHAAGGGVEQRIARACAVHRAAGRRPILLRPARTADGQPLAAIWDGVRDDFPNLRFHMPAELPALLRLLRSAHVAAVEVHHFLDHDPAIHRLLAQLALPYDVHVHDYAWFCPRIALVGPDRRYCGEPAPAACDACVADAGRFIAEDIPVADLIERSARFLAAAQCVIVPSIDAGTRMRRHFPALHPLVVPHDDDAALPDPPPPAAHDGRCRVCVLGAIGEHKGYDVLLACARDAAARDLKLDFVIVGTTIDDKRLLATGRIFVTGRFRPEEAVTLVRAQHASLGLLPSIWPETFCLALTELWQAGLTVAAFDIGAPAERIARTGRGFLLPPEAPAHAINNALIAAAGLSAPGLPHAGPVRSQMSLVGSNPLRPHVRNR
ncbi:MAG: glycosyltransferase [Acetobacteraceae bacterium]|nr:glycosyltransferase [Acetobacteraceae bacterium]